MNSVVVFGGGVGGSVIIRAFLGIPGIQKITCLVNTTDNGGHSGEIRKKLGIPPPGDIRRVICSVLATSVRRQYEFRDERGVVGNNILADLINTRGIFDGIHAFVSIFPEFPIDRLSVYPISSTPTDICMMVGSQLYRGQLEVMFGRPRRSFGELSLDPRVETLAESEMAINEAETIVIAPSGVVGSVAPILLVEPVKKLLQEKRLIWFAPLFSLPTDGPNPWPEYTEIIARLAKVPDLIVANSTSLPEKVKKLYQERGFYLVKPESTENLQVVDLLGEIPAEPPGIVSSPFPRYFIHIQHDVEKVRELLRQIL